MSNYIITFAIFLCSFQTVSLAQNRDSLFHVLETAYLNKDTSLLTSFIIGWNNAPLNTKEVDDTLKEIYSIYSKVFEAPKYYPWAKQNTLKMYSEKKYYLVNPIMLYATGDLNIKDDKSVININKKIIIEDYFFIEKNKVVKKTKLHRLKNYSDYIYFRTKYSFTSLLMKRTQDFSPSLKMEMVDFLYINESYKSVLDTFMGNNNYLPRIMNSITDDDEKKRRNFLNSKIIIEECSMINYICISRSLDFAVVYIYNCTENRFDVPIFLEKKNNSWLILYPNVREPHLYYKKKYSK